MESSDRRCRSWGENQSKPMLRLRRLLIDSYIDPIPKSVLGATRLYLRMAGAEDLEKLLKIASERWLGYEKNTFCKGSTSCETL